MSKPGSRIFDKCSGHGCYSPRPIITSSKNVWINNKGAARIGDWLMIHCCKNNCHPGNIAKGSKSVLINGAGAARIGDKVNCRSTIITGSSDVFIGD
jgi:uncharacterized Zn-binding protein involved in type VI secretion